MTTKQDFMKRAIELSLKNVTSGKGGPFGAVVVLKGKIIGEGWNKVTCNNDPTAHAEVEAIRHACQSIASFDLTGAEIFTSCEPCPMCLSAIYWARISKIYFANTKSDAADIEFDDAHIYAEIPKSISERKIPMEQLMRSDALKAFEAWKSSSLKVPY